MTSFMDRLKAKLSGGTPTPSDETTEDLLDYDKLVPLDAEDLAEQGILSAYRQLLPALRQFAGSPIEVTEDINNDEATYSVSAAGRKFQIWGVGATNADGWERATVAFFEIVNANLQGSSHKFYALYGGNDLSGMFLTEGEVASAKVALKKRSNWPWIRVNVPPHYGYPIDIAT